MTALLCNCTIVLGQAADDLESKMEAACREHKIPSLTIAAVSSDKNLATLCTGIRKRGANSKVGLEDLHGIGSNTKSMTSTLAAVLVEAGKIDWDTTIIDVWPKLNDKSLHPTLREVTLNDLLNHTSGLRKDLGGPEWGSFFLEKKNPPAERRRILKLIFKDKPETKRGNFLYSNLGYVVAAAMLEKKTGDAYESLMKRHLFKPLKMDSAYLHTTKTARRLKAPYLSGHDRNGKPVDPKQAGSDNPSVYSPAGTVHLSVGDYAKYVQWHLRAKPEPVLTKQETIEHLHKGHSDFDTRGARYSCGWIIFESSWGRTLQHAGTNTCEYAITWILPDKDVAATVLTNSFEPGHGPATNDMIIEMFKQFAK